MRRNPIPKDTALAMRQHPFRFLLLNCRNWPRHPQYSAVDFRVFLIQRGLNIPDINLLDKRLLGDTDDLVRKFPNEFVAWRAVTKLRGGKDLFDGVVIIPTKSTTRPVYSRNKRGR